MKKILMAIIVSAFLLTACASAGSRSSSANGVVAPGAPVQEQNFDAMPLPTMMANEPAKSAAGDAGGTNGSVAATSTERLVIQNADLSLVVKDPKKEMETIAKMAQELGGYVVSSNLYQNYAPNGETVPEATLTIRVPAPKLNDALDTIKKDALEVQSENRSGQDVTAEYVDLKSRLGTYEDALQQLEKIMEEKTTPQEVLDVFNQETYYREQIDLIKGQMKYYEESAALSAVSIKLIAEKTLQPLEIGGWEPKGVARDAIQNLIYFWQGFVDFMINFVLYTIPVLITIGIPLYLAFLFVRWLLRKMRKPKVENKTETK
jgi:hypothetical protein